MQRHVKMLYSVVAILFTGSAQVIIASGIQVPLDIKPGVDLPPRMIPPFLLVGPPLGAAF